MIAPYAGFSPAYEPCPRYDWSFQKWNIVAGRMVNMCAAAAATLVDHSTSGAISSKIQMLRPWVPSTRSLSRGWISMSSNSVVGRLGINRVQLAAASFEAYSACSVPRNSNRGFAGCSVMTLTEPDGRPPIRAVQVRLKSVVEKTYGAKLPSRWASKATYAAPAPARDGATRLTKAPAGAPPTLRETSVHVAPPSREP